MNKIVDKNESADLDQLIVMKNREYLIDHLVMEGLVKIG